MKLEKIGEGLYQLDCLADDKRVINKEELFDLYCQIDDVLEEEREVKRKL